MNLKAKRTFWLAGWLIPLAISAGCGRSEVVTTYSGATHPTLLAANSSFPDAPRPSITVGSLRHGLGAILEGTPTVEFDEGTLQTQGALPTQVDLRPRMSPIANQGIFGACTGFSIVKGLREYLLMREGRPFTPLSAGFLWYMERKDLGWPNEDKGAPISLGMKILDTIGTDSDADFPYPSLQEQIHFLKEHQNDPSAVMPWVSRRPSPQQVAEAKKFRVYGIQQVNSLHGIRKHLASGLPVIIGIPIYESFDTIGPDGLAPVPHPDKEKLQGGHAITLVGYDNARQLLIVKNSWGADWGDKGYFYLPYQFIRQGFAHDAWTVKPR